MAKTAAEPRVSIVVVNYNGLHHLGPCFQSLLALDYPRDRLELVVVDNGSKDGSVEFTRSRFPSVRVIANGANLGFARANNVGARHATGDLIATLNNDMRVQPDWLRQMVQSLDPGSGVVCAASTILTWDGKRVDFMGGRLNFSGHGTQPDFGARYVPLESRQLQVTPFACGGAMLIDRQVFLDAGGFDEDYFAFFEDVDLGWRLWIMGYRVVLVPTAIVYHRHHGTARRIAPHKLAVLYERNALYTIIKNYEQSTLEKALPGALFLLMERALHGSDIDRGAFDLGSPKKLDSQMASRLGLAGLVAAHQVIEQLPSLMAKRATVQAARRRSEAEIFRLWNIPMNVPTSPGRDYQQMQDKVIAAMNLDSQLLPVAGRRVLLVCHEPLGVKMGGPAIRYWELARTLARRFTVRLAHPGKAEVHGEGFTVANYDRGDYSSLATHVDWAEVVLAYGYVLVGLPELATCGRPLVVDLYDVFVLEELMYHLPLPMADQERAAAGQAAVLQAEMQAGDLFLCASERQRDFWLGTLAANGRVNPRTLGDDPTLRSLIEVVPFGIPSEAPRQTAPVLKGVHPKIAERDKLVVWGGGLWDWFDPQSLIKAMARVRDKRQDVKLYFMAKRHHDPDTVAGMRAGADAVDLCRQLGLLDECVFFGDWVPYAERANYLLEADLAVSLHLAGLETHFSFRTRLLDYIWAGVPILATSGDTLGGLVQKHGLGQLVAPGDVEGVAEAMLAMLADDGLRTRLAPSFAEVAADLTWEKAAEPLARFLQRPCFAPDRESGPRATGRRNAAARQAVAADGVKATPYYALPLRALQIVREGGVNSLVWEIGRYVRWWKLYRR